MHGFLYNFYVSGLGFDARVMGFAQAALIGGGLVGFLPAGRLTDRLGPRAMLQLAAVTTAAALAVGGLVASEAGIYASSALAGLGTAGWRVAVGPSLMRLTAGSNRPRWFGWNTGLLVAAGGTGVLVAGAVPEWLGQAARVSPLQSYRVLLVGSAMVTATSVLLFGRLALTRGLPTGSGPVDRAAMPVRLWLVLAAVVAWWMGQSLAGPFFNVYFRDALSVPMATIGVLFAIHGWTAAGASVLGGEAASRWGVERPLAALAGLLPLSVLGLALSGGVAPAAVWFLVHGLAGPGANPLIDQALFARCRPDQQGAVASWRHLVTDVAGVAGASLGGVVIADGGFRVMMAGAALVAGLGTVGLAATLSRIPAVATRPGSSGAVSTGS